MARVCRSESEAVAAREAVAFVFGRFAPEHPELTQRHEELMKHTSAAQSADAHERASRLLNAGNTAAQQGDFCKVKRLFEQSLEAAPSVIAYKSLADIAWSQQDAPRRSEMSCARRGRWRCVTPTPQVCSIRWSSSPRITTICRRAASTPRPQSCAQSCRRCCEASRPPRPLTTSVASVLIDFVRRRRAGCYRVAGICSTRAA